MGGTTTHDQPQHALTTGVLRCHYRAVRWADVRRMAQHRGADSATAQVKPAILLEALLAETLSPPCTHFLICRPRVG